MPISKKFSRARWWSFLLFGLTAASAGCTLLGPSIEEAEVQKVVQDSFVAAQSENINAFAANIHEEAPNGQATVTQMQAAFRDFDLQYTLEEIEVLSIDDDVAEVQVVQLTRKLRGELPFRNNRATTIHELRLSADGAWRIYQSRVVDVEYLDIES